MLLDFRFRFLDFVFILLCLIMSLVLGTLTIMVAAVAAAPSPAYPDAASACAAFNLTEKIGLMHGWGWASHDPKFHGYSRNSGCGTNVCGPSQFIRWDNGPQGFADHAGAGLSTQWPSTLNMAATFDPDLALRWGDAMGSEFWHKGTNIQEGPGANIARIEKNGRTFEYISGEDPVLGARMAVPLLTGEQRWVMAIGKHYMLNNQETDRSGVNEIVDEKVMMELYYPAFEAIANAGVAGFMCAYNRINGAFACENNHTINFMLKNLANFSGFVVSDWGATHSTVNAVNAGLDIDMPDATYFSEKLLEQAIADGKVTKDRIHDACLRIMRGWYQVPVDRRYPCNGGVCIHNNVTTPENKNLAREIASKSIVLLKNTGNLLPLEIPNGETGKFDDANGSVLKILLVGKDATELAYTAGQGSGGVQNSPQMVSALSAFQQSHHDISYYNGSSLDETVKKASKSDVTIVFGSAHSGEGSDRKDLLFSKSFGIDVTVEDTIAAVSKVQKRLIVVAIAPGQILTDWRHNVPAILCAFLPGEQFGNALYDVIFGLTTPQAKLPLTFPNKDNEQGMSAQQWPGVPSKDFPGNKQVTYSEGLIVGYRWYDKHGVEPAFPFGHGLSYGDASYDSLKVEGRNISFSVHVSSNACDTPQLYLGYPGASKSESVPTKVLRGFEKVCSEEKTLTFVMSQRDLSEWNSEVKEWSLVKGVFKIYVGSSSQDIRLTGSMVV